LPLDKISLVVTNRDPERYNPLADTALKKHTVLMYYHSVAELAHKPLYRVSCGDIGTNVDAIDKVDLPSTLFYNVILTFCHSIFRMYYIWAEYGAVVGNDVFEW